MSHILGDENRFLLNLTDLEKVRYTNFYNKHKECKWSDSINGKIKFIIIPNNNYTQIIVECRSCKETKDLTEYVM